MISQTVEYAVRSMLYLAAIGGSSATRGQIAAGTRVPGGYLSKVMRSLVVGGLVSSHRGPRGGFALARPAGTITLLDIVNAVDPLRRVRCCPAGRPDHVELCPFHRRLDDAVANVEATFRRSTLADLLSADAALGRTSSGPHGLCA